MFRARETPIEADIAVPPARLKPMEAPQLVASTELSSVATTDKPEVRLIFFGLPPPSTDAFTFTNERLVDSEPAPENAAPVVVPRPIAAEKLST